MKYDHENPLNEAELEALGNENFDSFLAYLDSKTEYLKQFTKPLSSYHTKRFASLSSAQQGKSITEEELKKANDIGRKNELEAIDKIKNKEWKEKEIEMLKKTVKNVKTDRSQWFD
jgi:uncharacterized protein YjaG (DUF416 family)|tara:strand:+ start:358 stop:705 length:348 start_codon:yes stop_codon:yes gene_type:complete